MSPLLTAALLLASVATGPRTFTVQPGSTLTYRLVHKFHEVQGTSKAVEGKARILEDGTVQVMIRAPLDSFDSGNSNRDAHMLEVTDAARNPYVEFKGVGRLTPPSSFPTDVTLPLDGEVTLKTARPIHVEVRIHFDALDHVTIEATFPVSLDEHQVERPSLVFVKVDDRVNIDAKLTLEADR